MSMVHDDDPYNWWTPTRALFLAIVNSMPARQRQKVQETVEGLVNMREQRR